MKYALALLIATCPFGVLANPVPAPGSEVFCTGFEETVEGAWFDQGAPALLFRIGSNRTGESCYAWLNSYASRAITASGHINPSKMIWDVDRRQTQNKSLTLDLTTKEAIYNFNGASAQGQITKISP